MPKGDTGAVRRRGDETTTETRGRPAGHRNNTVRPLQHYRRSRLVGMVFTRPSHIPLPSIWHRFSVTRGDKTLDFRVQDLTEDLMEPALQMLADYFTVHEPPCKYIDINSHPTAVAELKKLWRDTAKEQLSLVCLLEDETSTLVGVNVLKVACREDPDEVFHSSDKTWAALFGAVDAVSRSVDVFQRFQVDKYLNAYGLVVPPEWRGLGIGKEMLLARIPLCKALGIKVTATVFTAGASQAVAKNAGFMVLSEVTYEELAKKGFVFPGIEQDTKSSMLMALVVE